MSTPAAKYGSSMFDKSKFVEEPPYKCLKKSIYEGLIMTTGILISTFVVKKVKKDMARDLTTKNTFSLATVTILSKFVIEYAKEKKYLPYNI